MPYPLCLLSLKKIPRPSGTPLKGGRRARPCLITYPLCLMPFIPKKKSPASFLGTPLKGGWASVVLRHVQDGFPLRVQGGLVLSCVLSRNAAFFWGKQFSVRECSFSSWKAVFFLGKQFFFLESSVFSGNAVFRPGKQFFFRERSFFFGKAVFRFGNALLFKECAVLGFYVFGVTILSCGSKINVSDNQRVVNFW
jgi:hypothetical protein